MHTLVLAFDIERSGGTDKHDTIAIGASIVNDHFVELDSLFLKGYFPSDTVFEQRCWDEFWSKNQDKLEMFAYNGDLCKQEREAEMINSFQAFRLKWETFCKENNCKLELVSDNNVYDGGFINQLIFDYLPLMLPIPYNTQQKYKSFWETHSEQRGLLMGIDPEFKHDWGLTKRIGELFNVPTMLKSHDHNPANDAYTIAFEQQVMLGIRDGRISRR